MHTAVIVNPAKVRHPGRFRQVIDGELATRGHPPARYLLTTVADPGVGQAHQALDGGATRILVAGGDGTVRMALGALRGSYVPVGLLPVGTGNLLARNLRLPLRLGPAVGLALDGAARPMDLFRYEVPDTGADGYAVVMAGLGADAAVLADTHGWLKRLGWVGYAVAATPHIRARPFEAQVEVDGDMLQRLASLVTVGNVGELREGLKLLPHARSSDGVLDVQIASPRHALDVWRMATGVFARAARIERVDRRTGRDIVVRCAEPTLCQVDGDVLGRVSAIRFEVLPGAASIVRRSFDQAAGGLAQEPD